MSYQQDRITGIPAPLPKDYDRLFDFTGYEAQFPNTPKPGDKLDAEFNAIQQALDETQARLRLIQRDDGALTNESVGIEQLKSDVQAGVNPPSDWAEFTQYTVRDTVIVGTGKWYVALESHVSSDDFEADQQAGKWRLLLDLTPYTANFYEYESFTATTGQDTFAVDYDPNFVRVFKNGLRLFPDEYDSSSGTEVVLNTPCAEDDEVIVEGFTSVVDSQAASNFEVTADGTADTRTLGVWMSAVLQAVSDISDNATAIQANTDDIDDNSTAITDLQSTSSANSKLFYFHGWLESQDLGSVATDSVFGVYSGDYHASTTDGKYWTSSNGRDWTSGYTYASQVNSVSENYAGLNDGELWSSPETGTPALVHDFTGEVIRAVADYDGDALVGLGNGFAYLVDQSTGSPGAGTDLGASVRAMQGASTSFVPAFAVTRNGTNTAGKLWRYASGSWTELHDFASEGGCWDVSADFSGNILVATTSGLYLSTNSGSSFSRVIPGDDGEFTGCYVDSSGVLVAVSVNGIYVSTNTGGTWSRVSGVVGAQPRCGSGVVLDGQLVKAPVAEI